MATNKTYTVIKDGIELKELKTLATAKKLDEAEGAQATLFMLVRLRPLQLSMSQSKRPWSLWWRNRLCRRSTP